MNHVILRPPFTNAPELTHMLTEPKYLGNDKVNFLKMVGGWVFVCFMVFLFYSLHNLNLGGLLWPRHESRPGAETSLPE